MKSQNLNRKNILITPLGWGLGHAGRMIPLALRLKEAGHNVIVAGNNDCLSLFKNETKGIGLISFPGFTMRYSEYLPTYIAILVRIPSLIIHSCQDHRILKKIINEHHINIVISDNRFGCWNKKIKSVYVTHQLRIIFPAPLRFMEPLGVFFHRLIIQKYDLCFIPDSEDTPNISGDLSHNLKLPSNIQYIGLLSRFTASGYLKKRQENSNPYITILLSGPEPQKSILKNRLINSLRTSDLKIYILEGNPGIENQNKISTKVISFNHLSSPEMRDLITGSKYIICRAGYSTIMDLISLNLTALLIPTPGQTEQEYLANHLFQNGWFTYVTQDEENILSYLPKINNDLTSALFVKSDELLSKAIARISE